MTLSLLQAAAQVINSPTPQAQSASVTLGQAVAIAGGAITFGTLILGAVRLGSVLERVKGFEQNVVRKLDEFIAGTNLMRQEHFGWKGTTDARLATVEGLQVEDRLARHDLRGAMTEQLTDHETRISTLEGNRRKGDQQL
jgi:hypothetical protein